jgi:hypothetical protein
LIIPTMKTIRELAEDCKDKGITEHCIRQLVNSDKIPYIKAGRKFLINVDRFAEYFNSPIAGR